jgi:Mannosyltransferase (PIG-V)
MFAERADEAFTPGSPDGGGGMARSRAMARPSEGTAELWESPRLSLERRVAVRDAWGAFWSSRVLVWIAGMAAIVIFGWAGDTSARLDPLYLTIPSEQTFWNLLAAPAARFDSAWYLAIAEHGYGVTGRAAFFPVFPGLSALGGSLLGSPLLAGFIVSSASGLGALYLLHRLVALDFDLDTTRTVVYFVAWFPSAIVLSAVYTEALFLLVSIGSLYAARLGRWPAAGLLGGLAAASRSGGVILIVPLLILYLYGPRRDRPRAEIHERLGPRFPVEANILWILAGVPAGLLGYIAYLGISTGDPLSVLSAQSEWHRTFVPLGGLALGAWSALHGAFELLIPGVGRPASVVGNGVTPELLALRDIIYCCFLVASVWLIGEASRRLPVAYTAYAVCGLAVPLSMPAGGNALMSLPRFIWVLFPLWIALALWARERDRVRPVLVLLGTLLAISSALFATWTQAP